MGLWGQHYDEDNQQNYELLYSVFKIKNLNVQIVLTDDMYTCQKNMVLIKKTLEVLMRQPPAKTGSMLLPV